MNKQSFDSLFIKQYRLGQIRRIYSIAAAGYPNRLKCMREGSISYATNRAILLYPEISGTQMREDSLCSGELILWVYANPEKIKATRQGYTHEQPLCLMGVYLVSNTQAHDGVFFAVNYIQV